MEAPHSFCTIIDQSVIHQNQIRIPEDMVQTFKNELSDIVTLKLPNGGEWEVGFKRAKNAAWFHDGLKSFLEDNSIGLHYFLVFKYAENSEFNVHVFDLSATEIEYPVNTHGALISYEPVKDSENGGSGDVLASPSVSGFGIRQRRTSSAQGQLILGSYATRNRVGKLKEESVT